MRRLFGVILLLGLIAAHPVRATDFTSLHFIERDPVMSQGGIFASSLDFQYFSSLGQTVIGKSDTGASFGENAGFLYFPFVSTPVISATPGNGQVALTWTAAVGQLGFTVTSYDVGVASG